MADNKAPRRTDYESVYRDTNYFINAIISDYGFYGNFIDAIKYGNTEFEVKRKVVKKTVDEQWVNAIEDALAALDNAVRHPSRYIEDREDILPIELSRNITNKSIRHLAQHTDYINKVEDDMIIPSKILNVFHEETMLTYENKFLNTLLMQLYIFVNRRYTQYKKDGDSATSVSMDFNTDFVFDSSKGKIHFSVEMSQKNDIENGVSMSDRIEKLNSVVTRYYNSDFVRQMGKNYVRPPIIRTNAITKNKDLRQCLALWEFIQSYDKIGYMIDIEETAEVPNKGYIEDLYSMLSLQYMMFKFNMQGDFTEEADILDRNETEVPLEPRFKSRFQDIHADDYNVYDSEYRKVVPVSVLSNRRLSADELRIREAVDVALAAHRTLSKQRKVDKKRL